MGSAGSRQPSSTPPPSPMASMPTTVHGGADADRGGDAPPPAAQAGGVTFEAPVTWGLVANGGGGGAAAAAGGGGAGAGAHGNVEDGGGGAAPAVPVFDLSTAGKYKVHVTGRISEGGEIRWRLPERYSRVEHIGGKRANLCAQEKRKKL